MFSRYVVRRHSLRNASHPRVDSPTPSDLFPTEHSSPNVSHAPTNQLATKVVTEVKVMPSRPTGLSVTTTVPPMVLQRRPETEVKHCKLLTTHYSPYLLFLKYLFFFKKKFSYSFFTKFHKINEMEMIGKQGERELFYQANKLKLQSSWCVCVYMCVILLSKLSR